MITLITGTPGSGKTAYALDMMLRLMKLDNSRRLYVHGIPDLKIAHEIVVCDSQACDFCPTLPKSKKVLVLQTDGQGNELPVSEAVEREIDIVYKEAKNWHEWAENGSILFFDEVQNLHRPRGSGAAVPPNVAAYEVHRHKGLDFFMITQNPALIDSNVRSLISRHIHLTATWARRIQHEYNQCKTDLGSTTGESLKSNYVINKDVFSLYKSASLHTKVERKKPLVLFLLPLIFAFIFFLGYYEYNHFVDKAHPKTAENLEKTVNLDEKKGAGAGGGDARAATAAPAPVNLQSQSKTQVLDVPKLFKKWSQLGISDDELKFLPVSMCAVSSARAVKCKFSSNFSFKSFFSNISCTPDFCFAFLSRIQQIEERYSSPQREPMPAPVISPISLSSNS